MLFSRATRAGTGAAGTDGVSHEDVSGFHRLETELCIILRVCQCLKRPQLLIRKRVLKQEVVWVCISRLPELLSVHAPVRERERARARACTCGSSLAVIDGLLSFFALADPVFTLRHPNVATEPAACWRSSEEKSTGGEKKSLLSAEENSRFDVYFSRFIFI